MNADLTPQAEVPASTTEDQEEEEITEDVEQ